MVVIGGGVFLLVELYKGFVDSILLVNFSYVVIGSGIGKNVFLINNFLLFGIIGIVYYVGSDLVFSSSELSNYNISYNGIYGLLIQILLVVILVIVFYCKDGNIMFNLISV